MSRGKSGRTHVRYPIKYSFLYKLSHVLSNGVSTFATISELFAICLYDSIGGADPGFQKESGPGVQI